MKTACEALVILVEMLNETKEGYERTKNLAESSTQYILQDGIIQGLGKAVNAAYRLKGSLEEDALKSWVIPPPPETDGKSIEPLAHLFAILSKNSPEQFSAKFLAQELAVTLNGYKYIAQAMADKLKELRNAEPEYWMAVDKHLDTTIKKTLYNKWSV